ncbi:MAG: ORF6N domain-containing protein [Candidatus Cloacimonetes bacterium]|nr:ORF6N domain-containing protein [Candidatus Cloacimonadota bacterium]
MENEIAVLDSQQIQNKIYTIRGEQVMLDKDLAVLYGVKAIRLREQVKRNIERFPEDFMFQLSEEEVDFLLSQNAIPSKKQLGGSLPYVFTEQGVASISGVLTNKTAIDINIEIMRAFVKTRRFLYSNAAIFTRIDSVEKNLLEYKTESDSKFNKIFEAIEEKEIKPKQGIFFEGQIFDAYKFVSDLFRSAKTSILIIDNYIDDSVLSHLTKKQKNVKVTIYTKHISKVLKLDIKKFNSQYANITIKQFSKSHDRFIIIDEKDIYHFGASLKDLGKKWFAFSKFEKDALTILEKIKN